MDSNFFKQFPSTRSLPAADNLRSNEFNFVCIALERQNYQDIDSAGIGLEFMAGWKFLYGYTFIYF